MKKLLLLIIVITTYVLFPFESFADTALDTSWKARALVATENKELLSSQLQKYKEKEDSPEATFIKCQMMLESGYALFLTDPDIVHKKDENGWDFFHFTINGKDKGLFDLIFVYDSNAELVGGRVDLLPKDSHVMIMYPKYPNNIAFQLEEKCTVLFDLNNPLNAKIIQLPNTKK